MVPDTPSGGRAVGAVPVQRERGAASAKGVSSMKVYVGNLSYETTEAELRELFSAHGTVESVNLITEGGGGRSRVSVSWSFATTRKPTPRLRP